MNKLTMLPNELDTSKLKFSDIKTLDNGGNVQTMEMQGMQYLRIQITYRV